MRYTMTKTYGHERGLSCCFRQWRASSHCRFLHGYSLAFELTFTADALDKNGWVLDFGALKPLEDSLRYWFDHTMLVADDDPDRGMFIGLCGHDLAVLRCLPRVGCEAFAEHVFQLWEEIGYAANSKACAQNTIRGVELISVTVREHGANAVTITK